MSYQTLIGPALAAIGVLAVLVALARSIATTKRTDDEGVTRKSRSIRPGSRRRIGAAAAFALLVVPAVAVTPAGHRSVVFSAAGGCGERERAEGVSLVAPWVQHATPVDVRTRRFYTDQAFAQSIDLQEITVKLSVNYHVDPARADTLLCGVGAEYEQTVVAPAVFQLVKAEVGLGLAEDFAANRARLATSVQDALTAQLAGYGIVVEYVNIEDAVFDPQFIQAVKEKIVAEQEAEEQANLIEAERAKKDQAILQATGRAESTLIEATAQAKANEALAASLSAQLLEWQLLARWNGQLPTFVGGEGNGLGILIDAGAIAAE